MSQYIYDPPMSIGMVDYDLYNVVDWLWKAMVPTVDQLYTTLNDQQTQLTSQQQQLQTQQNQLQTQQNQLQAQQDAMNNALTQEAVNLTLTGNGFVSAPTVTAVYLRQGRMVTLTFPSLSALSNANTFTITGLGTSRAPATTIYQLVWGQDNGTATLIYLQLDSTAVISCARWNVNVIDTGPTPGYMTAVAWTTSGSKGIAGTTLVWALP